MYVRNDLATFDDYFTDITQRPNKVVYASVLDVYDNDIHNKLLEYYTCTLKSGIAIEDKLVNPTMEQIQYMTTTIGSDFELNPNFIAKKLEKWIQTLNIAQAKILSDAIYSVLLDLKKAGKNDSILKNAYTKFMCWFYYVFRSVLSQIGKNIVTKIMYEGQISTYELYTLEILARCGCDILILDYGIDAKVKEEKMFPKRVTFANGGKFPSTFNIKLLKKDYLFNQKITNMVGSKSTYVLCRNAWMNDSVYTEVKRLDRTTDKNLICSSFVKYSGAESRNSYVNEIYDFYTEVSKDRKIQVVEGNLPPLAPIEIQAIKRTGTSVIFDIVNTITSNINVKDPELVKYAKGYFVNLLKEKSHEITDLRKLEEFILKRMAYFNRYIELYSISKPGLLIVLEREQLSEQDYSIYEMLSNFPIDVVILNPRKNENKFTDLLEFVKDDVLQLDKFPVERTAIAYSTTAYNAEQDLTTMLYQDTGMYRDRQFKKAQSVILKTMYEEIEILWKEPLNMRQGFETREDCVLVPTIFAKVCGVKNGDKKAYLKDIAKLVTNNENVLYVQEHFKLNLDSFGTPRPVGLPANSSPLNIAQVLKNGEIDKEKVLAHNSFRLNFLRDETLTHMINNLGFLLKSGVIAGIGKNGVENKLLEVFFNLPSDVVNLIQKFDFSKINPKIVYINTGQNIISLEETILLQYLSFIGFDIVMFVPTGYNVIEKFFEKKLFTEYQLGNYVFDVVPNIKKKSFFK